MPEKNFYEILEVAPTATYHEIKKSYRNLAKKYHPDKNQQSAKENHEHFAKISEAYAVLSDLKKRKAYDDALSMRDRESKQTSFSFTQPHYSGYPYFQYDIFTPFFHSFFMGSVTPGPRTQKETFGAILLNYRSLLVSLIGALFFFKFFTALDGEIIEKKMSAGLFDNLSFHLIVKNKEGKEKRKSVKLDFFERLKVGDRIKKNFFSFSYEVNGEIINPVTVPRFLLQTTLIYMFLSGGLFYLERARK